MVLIAAIQEGTRNAKSEYHDASLNSAIQRGCTNGPFLVWTLNSLQAVSGGGVRAGIRAIQRNAFLVRAG